MVFESIKNFIEKTKSKQRKTKYGSPNQLQTSPSTRMTLREHSKNPPSTRMTLLEAKEAMQEEHRKTLSEQFKSIEKGEVSIGKTRSKTAQSKFRSSDKVGRFTVMDSISHPQLYMQSIYTRPDIQLSTHSDSAVREHVKVPSKSIITTASPIRFQVDIELLTTSKTKQIIHVEYEYTLRKKQNGPHTLTIKASSRSVKEIEEYTVYIDNYNSNTNYVVADHIAKLLSEVLKCRTAKSIHILDANTNAKSFLNKMYYETLPAAIQANIHLGGGSQDTVSISGKRHKIYVRIKVNGVYEYMTVSKARKYLARKSTRK